MYTSATDRPPCAGRPENQPTAPPDAGRSALKTGRGNLWKMAAVHLGAAMLAFAIDKVYALFAHGVGSPHMALLFLYPLLCGALVYALLALFAPGVTARPRWRLAANLYNSGIAALAAGSLLMGVFEIAGTASAYTIFFFGTGILLMLGGVVLALLCALTPPPRGCMLLTSTLYESEADENDSSGCKISPAGGAAGDLQEAGCGDDCRDGEGGRLC